MCRPVIALVTFAATLLAGCDMLGIDSPEKVAAAREADGKAVGGACRHAGRAIEDCYVLNKKADRAAVFAGWRDMNDYMRENKIDVVAPQLSGPVARRATGGDADGPAPTEKVAEKAPSKGDPVDKPARAEKGAAAKAGDKNDKNDKGDKAEKADKPAAEKSAPKAGTKSAADSSGAVPSEGHAHES